MKCRYFCRLPLDISPVYLTRGISFAVRAALYYVLLFCRVAFIIIGQLYSCIAHSCLIQIVSVAQLDRAHAS